MKKNMNFMLFILIMASYLDAHSTTIRVRKVKGRQAVIESSVPLEVNKTYFLEGDSISSTPQYTQPFQNRNNSISLGAQLGFIKSDLIQENLIQLSVRYGWNYSYFEFGPALEFQSYDSGGGAETETLVGGYFDYNLQVNKHPLGFIYGPTGSFYLGNNTYNTGGTAQIMAFNAGGFITYYLNNSSTALKAEGTYVYKKVSTTALETNLSGLAAKVFILFYF